MEVFSVGDVIKVKNKEYLELHRRESPNINEIMMRAADSIGVVSEVLRKDRVMLEGSTYLADWTWNTAWIEHYYPETEISDLLDSLFNDGW